MSAQLQCLCSGCCFGMPEACSSRAALLGPLFPFSPGYVYPTQPEPQPEPVKAPVKCDCGSEAAGLGDVHSDWCAKGRGP